MPSLLLPCMQRLLRLRYGRRSRFSSLTGVEQLPASPRLVTDPVSDQVHVHADSALAAATAASTVPAASSRAAVTAAAGPLMPGCDAPPDVSVAPSLMLAPQLWVRAGIFTLAAYRNCLSIWSGRSFTMLRYPKCGDHP